MLLIIGCSVGGCLLITILSITIFCLIRRKRGVSFGHLSYFTETYSRIASEVIELEENTDLNPVYGTYGECGETDYSTVEDTNMDYEATE